jgi:UDP-N-acetylglucosamine 2-epimerase
MSAHLLSIVGARPQFVKAAMVIDAVREYDRDSGGNIARHTLVHTGQHYDPNLSDVFFQELPLPRPDYNLGVGSGTHGKQTGTLLASIERVLIKEEPDAVIVYGDTNSTVAGALAAAKLNMAVAHVEAGLRSFNRRMPEEINRVVTDHISTWLLCPTETAVKHLAHEGITEGVYHSGDVMLDAVLKFQEVTSEHSPILDQLKLTPGEYALFTMHRAENTDSVTQIAAAVELLIEWNKTIVFPVHPRTWNRLTTLSELKEITDKLRTIKHVKLIDPVSYLEMLALERNARVILTDSGGVQKEAYFLSVPCVTLRGETEWTETLSGGWNRLVQGNIHSTIELLDSVWACNGMQPVGRPNLLAFGGGNAAKLMVRQLMEAVSEGQN